MGTRMDWKIEKLYGSRPSEGGAYNDGKVRIEILYHQRDYRVGPVPGGFVVERSRGYCKAFMVDRNNNLLLSLDEIFEDALVAIRFDHDLEKKLLNDTRSAVCSLPDPTFVNGTWIAPELLVRIDLEIQRQPVNNVSSSSTSISSRTRPYLNNNISSTSPSSRQRSSYPNNNVSRSATMTSSSGPIRRRLHANNHVSTTSINAILMESMRIQHWRTMPANKSTIKRLEKIRVASKGATLEQDWCCALCLESRVPEGGLKVIRLPCKHIFHDECIVKWLVRRKSCPLCRSHV